MIYEKFASRTFPHPKKNIQFWIDEFVAHFQIPIFGNHNALFSNKKLRPVSRFRKLLGCKKKNAGRRSL